MKQQINEFKRMQVLAGIINENQLNEIGGKGDTPDNPKLQAAVNYLVQNRDRFISSEYYDSRGIAELSPMSDKELYDYLIKYNHSDALYDAVSSLKGEMNKN